MGGLIAVRRGREHEPRLARPVQIGLSRGLTRLRNDFNGLLRLEAGYRRGGLTQWERADLDRRFDRLSASIRYERRDRDNHRS